MQQDPNKNNLWSKITTISALLTAISGLLKAISTGATNFSNSPWSFVAMLAIVLVLIVGLRLYNRRK